MRRSAFSTLLLAAALTLVAVLTLAACSDDATKVTAGDGGDTTTTTSEPSSSAPTTSSPPTPGPAPSPPPTSGPKADLVLQIHTGGGFVPADYAFASLPEFTLYADGRVIVTGPTTMEFPGPATPNLLTGTIAASAVRDAVTAAKDAGVTGSPDLGQPAVADAPTTTFVLVDGGRTAKLDAYALGFNEGPGLSAGQLAARRRLEDLRTRMTDLGAVAKQPYRATAVSILARPYAQPEPGSPPVEPAPGQATWPLGNLSTGGRDQFDGRCLGFTGAEADQVLAAAAKARSNTQWRSGGATWSLTFRPELPGTQPCAPR